ncbi:hypothetical protein [Pelagibius sp. Alg239-R121]|uniref:hypothetical protein n=1 Tax=Pelagibius sp. Alg239-R121 TaxID=2993448 RepID=UPI0024A63DED|nr:hypothetical protein [Pelagibius sp. Alg239-R121]
MAKLRKFRRLALLPLIAWLLAQIATTSVFAQRVDVASPVKYAADSFSAVEALAVDTLVICTPKGLMVISLDSEGRELPEESTFYPGCQWCQPFGGSAAISGPEQSGPTASLSTTCHYRINIAQVLPRDGGATAFHSRAPPL